MTSIVKFNGVTTAATNTSKITSVVSNDPSVLVLEEDWNQTNSIQNTSVLSILSEDTSNLAKWPNWKRRWYEKALAFRSLEDDTQTVTVIRPPVSLHRLNSNATQKEKPILAVITSTRSTPVLHPTVDKALLVKYLIKSIDKTVTESERNQWNIRLYVAVDADDKWWLEHLREINPPRFLEIIFGVFEKKGHHIPFAEMANVAYQERAEYYCRVNDDTEFHTQQWITLAVNELANMDPPNLGVVGPYCKEGKNTILTHDFVHRTHLDALQVYYPLVFENWFLDDWITLVYSSSHLGINRTKVIKNWKVKHWVFPNRYVPKLLSAEWLPVEYERGRRRILDYVRNQYPNHKVIPSIADKDPFKPPPTLDRKLVEFVKKYLPENGNLLIWGHEKTSSDFWHSLTMGRVTFIEQHNVIWTVNRDFPQHDAEKAVYAKINGGNNTCDYEIPRFSNSVRQTPWHVILVKSSVHEQLLRNLFMSRQLAHTFTNILHVQAINTSLKNPTVQQVLGIPKYVGDLSDARYRLVRYPVHDILKPCDPPPLARDVKFFATNTPMHHPNFINTILNVLPEDGNLLIWGLDTSSDFWHYTTYGKVVFLEDKEAKLSNKADKRTYIGYHRALFPQLQIYPVGFTTKNDAKLLDLLDKRPDRWSSVLANKNNSLPDLVSSTRWDVILIDGPGFRETDPGRLQSIFWSRNVAQSSMWKDATRPLHIFVHDFQDRNTQIMAPQILDKEPENIVRFKKGKVELQLAKFHFNKTDFAVQGSISEPAEKAKDEEELNSNFTIIVLTMNRVDSLKRLLTSIENAEYEDDKVRLVIKIDVAKDRESVDVAVQQLAKTFLFTHGPKRVEIAESPLGLRGAWLHAWTPPDFLRRAIILEDDLELSPVWYKYVKHAWAFYGTHMTIGGISLNRQSLIPDKKALVREKEIVNEHKPFLYKLVGSQGFSPNPWAWAKFLNFVQGIENLETFDADVPGLVTSDWYKKLDKRHMWTQLFIYFCEKHGLYTLYVNLPEAKTLSAHWREKGEHFDKSMGRDFDLATDVSLDFPEKLTMYGWDGEVCGTFENKKQIESSTAGRNGQSAVINLIKEGSEYGGWTYDPSYLNSTSVVYSVGIGEDTSWDEAIIEKHNLHVWGFDPTPKALRYVESRSELHTPNFHMIPEGLSTSKRVATFTMPANPDHVSMREGTHGNMGEEVDVNVNTLENWMKENDHTHLDLLKIDIEGSEYDVLEDWVSRNFFPMDQLLVEWHFRFFEDGKQRHNRLLEGLKSRGWQIAYTSPSGQEMTLLRKSESSVISSTKLHDSKNDATWKSDSAEDLLKISQKMASGHGVVMIQMLNDGFVDMTKSWVCNVRIYPGLLENVLFIATDESSYNELKSFNNSLHVIKILYDAPKKLSYGDHDYFSFMLFRTELLIKLLEREVPIFLIESDAVWLDDPTSLVLSTPGDIVTMSDTLPPRTVLQGGFQLLRPTAPTVSVWKKLLHQFEDVLQQADKDKYLGDGGSEQLMLDKLIRREPELKVSWLPREYFVPGIYYRDPKFAASITNPKVILNNYIVGIDKKIERAKQWNHWFLNDDGSCATNNNQSNPRNPVAGQELVGTERL